MNLKPLNQYITCTKFKMTTLKQVREAIHSGQWVVSLNIKSAHCHIPIARKHCCFLCFQWKGKAHQFKTLPFCLFTAPNTITRVTKPVLLLFWKMGITKFLYLDNALVLANSYTQAKENEQKVVQLVQKLGFVMRLKKCQLEPTQEFTHWTWCSTLRT